MKSEHTLVLATLKDNGYMVTLQQGEFPLDLALDSFLKHHDMELVAMSPYISGPLQGHEPNTVTLQQLLVLRKRQPDLCKP